MDFFFLRGNNAKLFKVAVSEKYVSLYVEFFFRKSRFLLYTSNFLDTLLEKKKSRFFEKEEVRHKWGGTKTRDWWQ